METVCDYVIKETHSDISEKHNPIISSTAGSVRVRQRKKLNASST